MTNKYQDQSKTNPTQNPRNPQQDYNKGTPTNQPKNPGTQQDKNRPGTPNQGGRENPKGF